MCRDDFFVTEWIIGINHSYLKINWWIMLLASVTRMGDFYMLLATNCVTKLAQICCWLFGIFLIYCHYYVKVCEATIWAFFGNIRQLFIPWSGHTSCNGFECEWQKSDFHSWIIPRNDYKILVFGISKHTIQFSKQLTVNKVHPVFELRPLENESPSITTRPGLPPN